MASEMPIRSFLPEPNDWLISTIRMAPAMPKSTPNDFIGVIFSPMVNAAQSITATGVSVAMSEK